MLRLITGSILLLLSLHSQAACPPLLDLKVRTLASDETVMSASPLNRATVTVVSPGGAAGSFT